MAMKHRGATDDRPVWTGSDSAGFIESFDRAVAFETDVTALRETIRRHLQAVGPWAAAIWFSYKPEDASYIADHLDEIDEGARQSIPAEGALVRWLRVNRRPLVLTKARWITTYLSAEEQRLLHSLEAHACVPLTSSSQLMAIVVLAGSSPKSAVDADSIEVLAVSSRRAALALELLDKRDRERQQLEIRTRAQQLAVAGQLAASVAHEVKNPLTAIRSGVQLLLDPAMDDGDRRGLLKHVLEEVDRIDHTVSGIVGLARPHRLQLSDLDFVDVVEDALQFMRPHLMHHHVTVDRQFKSRPLPIRADARELRQVLLNVIFNACQAMSAGGTLTVLSEQCEDASGPSVIIKMIDTGRGMSSEQLAHAFDPFFTTRDTGTGLGLPISLDIMSRHGGDIRLTSQLGHGTTISLMLPPRAR